MSPDRKDYENVKQWARETWDAIQPHSDNSAYVNYLAPESDEGRTAVEAAYGFDRYRRLAEVKNAYDPDNIFRMNQNIVPAR